MAKRILSITAPLLLILGLIAYVVARAQRPSKPLASGYTLVSRRVQSLTGQQPKVIEILVRRVKSSGEFREDVQRFGTDNLGKPAADLLYFSRNGMQLGYEVGSNKLVTLSDYNPTHPNYFNEEKMRLSPELRKTNPEEWVMGVKSLVMRVKEAGEDYVDLYYSASLKYVIKMVVHTSKVHDVKEPIAITYGEPDDTYFENLPVFPEITKQEADTKRKQGK